MQYRSMLRLSLIHIYSQNGAKASEDAAAVSKTDAEAAKTAAVDARDKAQTAKTAAENARESAETSEANAKTYKESAAESAATAQQYSGKPPKPENGTCLLYTSNSIALLDSVFIAARASWMEPRTSSP